jgi:CBS domain-containing protein
VHCPNCAKDNIPGVDVCEDCGTDLAGLDTPEARGGFRGRLLTARLGDLPISKAVVLTGEQSVRGAIESMRKAGSGCALITEDGKLVGLFNERHVLTRVVRHSLDLDQTRVSEVMSRDPLELTPEDPPAFAIHCMVAYGFRHLPLVSGGKILGYISVRNILAFLHEHVIAGPVAAT